MTPMSLMTDGAKKRRKTARGIHPYSIGNRQRVLTHRDKQRGSSFSHLLEIGQDNRPNFPSGFLQEIDSVNTTCHVELAAQPLGRKGNR